MGLDITKLIERAEEIIVDEQLGFVAEITFNVQEFEYKSLVKEGEIVKYKLQLVLTSEPDKDPEYHDDDCILNQFDCNCSKSKFEL